MDPYKGVIRWSAHRAREHFAGVLSTVVAIPAIAAIVAAFVGLPSKPTPADQIENALIGLGSGIIFVALVAALYALLRAPYEQRAMLRDRLSLRRAEILELESSVHETLALSGLVITRAVPDLSRPEEYNHLQFTLTFSNNADVAVKYSLQSAAVELPGILPIGELAHDQYRIGAEKSNQYIIYANFDPVQQGRAVGILDYRLWYGPTSNPDMYEQHYRIQFANTPDVNYTTSSTSHIFLPGGTDEIRLSA
jgi:hypothetical protein